VGEVASTALLLAAVLVVLLVVGWLRGRRARRDLMAARVAELEAEVVRLGAEVKRLDETALLWQPPR
jgi:outer membrane murein-binding lipoprotein Lpp